MIPKVNTEKTTIDLEQLLADESGFTIIELLVSLVIIAIFGLAMTSNTSAGMKYSKFTEANHIASSLGISKMEEIAAFDAVNIDSNLSQTENSVAWPGTNFTFTRTTAVTLNADDSRTVTVTVSSNNSPIPTTVDFTTTFAIWE